MERNFAHAAGLFALGWAPQVLGVRAIHVSARGWGQRWCAGYEGFSTSPAAIATRIPSGEARSFSSFES